MRYNVRELSLLAILAALNAAVEIGIGTWLHLFRFPLVGSVMVGLNVALYLLGRKYVPRFGSILIMGSITAFLKFLYSGGLIWAPVLAIFLEAGLVEVVVSLLRLNLVSTLTSSVLANVFTLIYPALGYVLVGGPQTWRIGEGLMERGRLLFPHGEGAFLIIGAFMIHVIIGGFWGIFAWKILTMSSKVFPSAMERPAWG